MRIPMRLGILGGGQLARMLALKCREVGVVPVVLAAKKTDCALGVVGASGLVGMNAKNIRSLCRKVDVITIESEFVDLGLLKENLTKPIYPTLKTLSAIQSKLSQKEGLSLSGIPTLPFVVVRSSVDLQKALAKFGGRGVLKQARLGYDGKGTYFVSSKNLGPFKDTPDQFEGYCEPIAEFEMELSVVIARGLDGIIAAYPVFETFQRSGICNWVKAGVVVPRRFQLQAIKMAKKVIERFNGVGVFAVEMFLLKNGELVVNEIAPRVHNSGHITLNNCLNSQFEQHIRAVLGLPLGLIQSFKTGAMVNIIGSKKPLKVPARFGKSLMVNTGGCDVWIHWYEKVGKTRNRKLGHINVVGASAKKCLQIGLKIRNGMKV